MAEIVAAGEIRSVVARSGDIVVDSRGKLLYHVPADGRVVIGADEWFSWGPNKNIGDDDGIIESIKKDIATKEKTLAYLSQDKVTAALRAMDFVFFSMMLKNFRRRDRDMFAWETIRVLGTLVTKFAETIDSPDQIGSHARVLARRVQTAAEKIESSNWF